MLTRRSAAVVLSTLAACAIPALAGEGYTFTVNQQTSSLAYQTNVAAPFAGSLIGANDTTLPANQQTRTKQMLNIFTCGTFGATQNDPINISGSITATGSSPTPSNIRPAGTLAVGFNETGLTSFARNLNLQLLSSGAITITANLSNFNYQSFCATNPSCNAPFLITPPPIPLGSVSVTSLQITQEPGDATGTLTPAGPQAFDFSIPMNVTITPIATFLGSPLALDPQVVPIVFTGTITRVATPLPTATLASNLAISFMPPANTTPTALPPTPFTIPADSILCPNINVVLSLTLNSTTVSLTNTATLAAAGPKIPCPCDINASNSITVQDIFDFLNLWFANDPRADFNHIGGVSIQDIFDFLTCWFSPPREC